VQKGKFKAKKQQLQHFNDKSEK